MHYLVQRLFTKSQVKYNFFCEKNILSSHCKGILIWLLGQEQLPRPMESCKNSGKAAGLSEIFFPMDILITQRTSTGKIISRKP